jgi:hypothetical protein
MTYALFFAPAAVPVAVLTLVLVPILSLVVFMIGVLAVAAAAVAIAVNGVAALLRARTAPQPDGGQRVLDDSERSLSCS